MLRRGAGQGGREVRRVVSSGEHNGRACEGVACADTTADGRCRAEVVAQMGFYLSGLRGRCRLAYEEGEPLLPQSSTSCRERGGRRWFCSAANVLACAKV